MPGERGLLTVAAWPEADPAQRDEAAEAEVGRRDRRHHRPAPLPRPGRGQAVGRAAGPAGRSTAPTGWRRRSPQLARLELARGRRRGGRQRAGARRHRGAAGRRRLRRRRGGPPDRGRARPAAGRDRAAGEEARQREVRGARARRRGRGRARQARRVHGGAASGSDAVLDRCARPRSTCSGLELFGMRFGLDRMHRLTTTLGMPQRRFASIHVVGLQRQVVDRALHRRGAGAPRPAHRQLHVAAPGARSASGSRWARSRCPASASPRRWSAPPRRPRSWSARSADDDDAVTQFEALTAAAYHELAARKVEVAVVEAGLGGRYDATNVIPSKVQVLTGVGLEHTRWLGPTIADIAEEKLAVVRDHATLVTAPLDPAARRGGRARGRASATRAGSSRRRWWTSRCAPRARSSARTSPLACAAAEAFLGRALDPGAVADAAAETRIPGRLDPVSRAAAGAARRRPQPGRRAGPGRRRCPEVLGRPAPARAGGQRARGQGRRGHAGGAAAATSTQVVFTRCANPRSLSPGHAGVAGGAARRAHRPRRSPVPPTRSSARARWPGPDGAVVVTGSIYLIADLVQAGRGARASTM